MRIGICDDSLFWRNHIKTQLLQYTQENDIATDEVQCFSSAQELTAYKGKPLDVLFMDIELQEESKQGQPEGNGIALAREINRRWSSCRIIYLTSHVYYASDVYKSAHVFFALKDEFAQRLGEIFSIILHELEQTQKKLFFTLIGGGEVSLAPADILYFERIRRKTAIHTVWGIFEVWDGLSEVEKKLSALDFVRCHNSFIVYLPAILKVNAGSFSLADGTEILISRSRSKETKDVFSRWAQTQMI